MDLSRVHKRFQETLKIPSGGKLRGQITDYTDEVSQLKYPSRLLKVDVASSATPGTVVVTSTGYAYVLAAHLDSHNAGAVYRTFRMIRVDEKLSWSREEATTDPVTGLARGSGVTPLGDIDVMVDPISRDDGKVKFGESRVRLVCGADLKVGDRVGDYSVLFVDQVLGVTVAEAR